MAVSYLVNPVTWVADSSGEPTLTISSIPAGSNRKLTMTLTCRDSDTWNITTLTIGGQSYTSITSPAVVDSTQSITAIWNEAAIAAMSGTALSFADDTFQSPQGASYYVVQDVDQAAAVVTDSGLTGQNTAEATVTTSGNTANDLVVVTGAISDNLPSFDDYDGGSLTEDQQQTLTNLTCMTASHQGTDTSFTVGTTGSTNDVILQAVVHKAAAAASVTVTNVDDITLNSDQTSVTITGTGFNATQSTGRVLIAPTDDVTDTDAVAQTIVSWSDTSIVFNVNRGSLVNTSTHYLFVENSDDESNASGYNVSFVDETPSFSSAPAVSSQTDQAFTIGFTTDFDCTVYVITQQVGETTPTAAQIKAGNDFADLAAYAAASKSANGTVAATITLSSTAGLPNPVYDIHAVASNQDGDSSVSTISAAALDPATGKAHVTASLLEISAASQANPVQLTVTGHGLETGRQVRIWGVGGMTELNTGHNKDPANDDGVLYYEVTVVDPNTLTLDDVNGTGFTAYTSGGYLCPGQSIFEGSDVVDSDIAVVDSATSPDGYAITWNSDGTFVVAASGDDSKQTIVANHYDASATADPSTGSRMTGEVTFPFNNAAPALSGGQIPPGDWRQDVAIPSINLAAYIQDEDGDAVTYAITGGTLPAGVTLDGAIISGTPTEQRAEDIEITATDSVGDAGVFAFTYIVDDEDDPNQPTSAAQAPADQTVTVEYESATITVEYTAANIVVDT